jgi:AcrR family transcriptional regulator
MNNILKTESRDEKKSLILQAGIRVLSKQGVSKTSMNDIIRESGLSKGGVYHYFSGKNELLVELFNYFIDLYAFSNLSRLENNPELQQKSALQQIDILFQQHESVIDDMGKNMSLLMDLYIEAIHNKALRKVFNQQRQLIFGIVKTLIETAQKQGDIKKNLNSSMIAASLLALFDGFGMVQQIDDNPENNPRMALEAARLILAGAANK